jgi:hypothetical protein
VRRIDRARAARRARCCIHALLVEGDEQRLSLDAGNRGVQQTRDAARRVAVRSEVRDLRAQVGLQAVAQRTDASGLVAATTIGDVERR